MTYQLPSERPKIKRWGLGCPKAPDPTDPNSQLCSQPDHQDPPLQGPWESPAHFLKVQTPGPPESLIQAVWGTGWARGVLFPWTEPWIEAVKQPGRGPARTTGGPGPTGVRSQHTCVHVTAETFKEHTLPGTLALRALHTGDENLERNEGNGTEAKPGAGSGQPGAPGPIVPGSPRPPVGPVLTRALSTLETGRTDSCQQAVRVTLTSLVQHEAGSSAPSRVYSLLL